MKKTGKRVFSLLVCLILLLTVLPQLELSVVASGTCGYDLTWTFSKDGTLTVSGIGRMYDYDIILEGPGFVNETPWRYYQQDINAIVIEDGVTYIGKYAFHECRNLKSVTLAESVSGIGERAFVRCGNLKQVTIPKKVKSIENSAFAYCYNLSSVILSDGVQFIDEEAFAYCASLTDMIIPASVTKLGNCAFKSCTSLISVTFLGNAPDIVAGCFFGITPKLYYPCGDETWTDEIKNRLSKYTLIGHVFGDYQVCQQATCTQNAVAVGTCAKCGASETLEVPGTAIGHSYDKNGLCTTCSDTQDMTIRMARSEYKNNIFDYEDSACIEVYCDGVLLQEVEIEWYTTDAYATIPYAPCRKYTFKMGSGTAACEFEISVKGKMVVSVSSGRYDKGETIHTVNSTLAHQKVNVCTPPTDTEDGSIADICVLCGCTDVIAVLHATGHDYKESVTPPTCTEDGFTTCNCNTCGFSGVVNTIPATGHSYEETVTPPTCTEAGSITGLCTTCGHSEVLDTPPATGHSFGEYVTKQEAGCEQDETQVKTCKNCGTTETITVPDTAMGHKYDVNGLCVNCGRQFSLVIHMTDTYGDSWNGSAILIYTDDTLMTEVSLPEGPLSGKSEVPYTPGKIYTLKWKSSSSDSECGFKITLNGEALVSGQGNRYSGGQLLCTFETACAHVVSQTAVTPPTCTEKGFTTGDCTVCGYSGIIDTTPAAGHSYADGVCTVCGQEEGLAGGSCGDGLQWRLYDDGRLTISGTGPMKSYSMPDDGSEPDTPWYQYRHLITRVVIETGATTIGEYAFHGCQSLTDVTIPESVTTIGKLAFYNCIGLTEMTIPKGVTTIGSAVFRRCSGLTKVTISEGVTTIGKIAFFDCTGLTEVTIPKSVTSIGDYAFGNCAGLTNITFLGSAPSMDLNSFIRVTATAIYPCNNKAWTNSVKQNYGGAITWQAGHSFSAYIPDENATCTEDGTATKTCPTCGATHTKTLLGTAIGHTKTTITGYPATCTEDGLTDGVQCAVCNEVLIAQKTIPAAGHSYGAIVTLPSCTEEGFTTYFCSSCADTYIADKTDPIGHIFKNDICTICGAVQIIILPGDLNGDGERNTADVASLYAHIKGTASIDSDSLSYADVNGDGNVNIGDIAKLYAHVKGTKPLY